MFSRQYSILKESLIVIPRGIIDEGRAVSTPHSPISLLEDPLRCPSEALACPRLPAPERISVRGRRSSSVPACPVANSVLLRGSPVKVSEKRYQVRLS